MLRLSIEDSLCSFCGKVLEKYIESCKLDVNKLSPEGRDSFQRTSHSVLYICHTCIKRHELLESTASIGDKDNNEDDNGDNNDHHATKKRKKLEVIEIDGDVLPSDIGGIELSQMSQMSGITSSPASARTGNSRTSDIARPPKKSKSNKAQGKRSVLPSQIST